MSTADELAGALGEAVGGEEVVLHEALVVDGHEVRASFRPRSPEALAEGLAVLSRRGAALAVRGGGELLHEGNTLERLDLLLDTRSLSGVDAFETDEGVLHAGAGTPVAEIREKAAAEGWELPLDAPGTAATLGGVLAAAAAGPRSQAFGPPRDAILGLAVALPNGERTRCGGRVVKNVTGFDLAKLYAGSFGTLGVIESAWLRLRPRPAEVRTLLLRGLPLGEGCLAASRYGSVRAAVWLDPATGGLWLPGGSDRTGALVCELAGAPESVARDAGLLSEIASVEVAPEGLIDRLRDRRALAPEAGRLRARLSALPTRSLALAQEIGATFGSDTRLCLMPALGEIRVEVAWEGLATAARLRTLARERGGHAVLEALPPGDKAGVDCFGLSEAPRRLMAEIARRFDPTGLLSPGRFSEGGRT